jgi:ABC-type glycerol-3-phosphate transport system permease component
MTVMNKFKRFIKKIPFLRYSGGLKKSKIVTSINFLTIFLIGLFMSIPFIYAISNAFKPLDELFIYPPRMIVTNPTLNNFSDLFVLMSEATIPFSRYFFNTIFVTVLGTAGHVILASLAAFILAKYVFPGNKIIFQTVIISLLFVPQVTSIPNFITMSQLKLVDNPLSLIVPAFGLPLGLFLMKQFMETMVPNEVLESARVDGAGILSIFVKIALPMVKPAWLTLIIFSIQGLWNINSGTYIMSEEWKTLSYALSQIVAGGIARAGIGSAVAVIIMIVPITAFVLTQSKIVETMSTSGIKG